jgi:hypothetical protein
VTRIAMPNLGSPGVLNQEAIALRDLAMLPQQGNAALADNARPHIG